MSAVVGTRTQRKEDPPLLTGEARFVADVGVPGALHLALVRSPHAHARIRAIDTAAAAAMPGGTHEAAAKAAEQRGDQPRE